MTDAKWPALWPTIQGLHLEPSDDHVNSANPLPLIRVTGKPGSGKTLFGLRIIARPPGEVAPVIVWDYEKSAVTYASQYAMRYEDMSTFKAPKDAFTAWMKLVESLKEGEYAVALIDTGEDWEDGLKEYVMANPSQFGYSAAQFAKSGRASGFYWGAVKDFEREWLVKLAAKVQTIVVTSHLRQKYMNDAPVKGQFEMRGSEALTKLSTLSVWLTANEKGLGAPSASITRCRLHVPDWKKTDDYGVPELKPVLPPTIPLFDAANLRKYMDEPRKKFSAEELAVTNPSINEMSDDERQQLKLQVLQEENALLNARNEAEERKAKLAIATKLIEQGVFESMDMLKKVAEELKADGVEFDAAEPETFVKALTARGKSKEATPEDPDPLLRNIESESIDYVADPIG